MAYTTIISTQELFKNLRSENWVILDCRFDLAKPEWGHSEYQKSHIPGALFADLNLALSGPIQPNTGRHPLPDSEVFLKQLSLWGITSKTQVIVYDANSGGFASRAWWLLRLHGYNMVAVLDGGWQKWEAELLPATSKVELNSAGQITLPPAFPDNTHYVTSDQVLELLGDPAYRLIDVRAGERYRGEIEPIDPVAGHIPGAVNRPTTLNLTDSGIFKPADQLRSEIQTLLGEVPAQNAIIYCGSGVTSCHLVLAMEIAGIPGAKIYAGSWSEWIRDAHRPISK